MKTVPRALFLLAAITIGSSPAFAAGGVRRFALLAGSNDGGPGRLPLRYAASDADAMAVVLERLGGLEAADTTLLRKPSRADLMAALESLRRATEEARRAGAARAEVLFYYSGHSDEQGLLLGTERIGYDDLRAMIGRIPADVRIAILDSCASGALLRTKGGRRVPAFMLDESTAVRGHAFLTASSADEAAQESDRIKGSYFTQSLLTGLRGAADANADGKVTLNEAYQYAFDETLERTEKTSAGPQHPAYDIQLAGSGDLVMTDLRATSAGLVLSRALEGRVTLRDGAGRLVAELRKIAGRPVELGLEPGTFTVTVESGGTYRTEVVLAEGRRVELDPAQLARLETEPVARRGGTAVTASVAGRPLRTLPFSFSLLPELSFDGGDRTLAHVSFNLIAGRHARLEGFELGVGLNLESESAEGLQIAAGANIVEGDVAGLQISSAANVVGGSFEGAQINAAFNFVNGTARGIQIGAGANVAVGRMAGLQIAGGANIAGALEGAQIAPVNLAEDALLQVGVVNVGLGSSALRIGVVNAGAKVPLQIGVINVAEESDVPIGLINVITGNGYFRATAWASDTFTTSAGLKMGGRYVYSILGVGADPSIQPLRWGAIAGLGLHTSLADSIFLDTDLIASLLFSGASGVFQTNLTSLRFGFGWQIAPRFAVVGGPTLNVENDWGGDRALDLARLPQVTWVSGGVTTRLFPGFTLGIQI